MPVRRITPVNVEVTLQPGEEWHSGELRLRAGDVVTISCLGSRRFYAGLFDRPTYFERRKAVLGMFDFAPGSDRPQFTAKEEIAADEWYYLVLRESQLGVNTTIRARLEVERQV
jgi:hypothetical protein